MPEIVKISAIPFLFVNKALISLMAVVVHAYCRPFEELGLSTRSRSSLSFGCGELYTNLSFRGFWLDVFFHSSSA
jgi:hypothetical protein